MDKKVYFHLNLFKQTKEQLKKEAKEKGMTLNSYVNLIISERKK